MEELVFTVIGLVLSDLIDIWGFLVANWWALLAIVLCLKIAHSTEKTNDRINELKVEVEDLKADVKELKGYRK